MRKIDKEIEEKVAHIKQELQTLWKDIQELNTLMKKSYTEAKDNCKKHAQGKQAMVISR